MDETEGFQCLGHSNWREIRGVHAKMLCRGLMGNLCCEKSAALRGGRRFQNALQNGGGQAGNLISISICRSSPNLNIPSSASVSVPSGVRPSLLPALLEFSAKVRDSARLCVNIYPSTSLDFCLGLAEIYNWNPHRTRRA